VAKRPEKTWPLGEATVGRFFDGGRGGQISKWPLCRVDGASMVLPSERVMRRRKALPPPLFGRLHSGGTFFNSYHGAGGPVGFWPVSPPGFVARVFAAWGWGAGGLCPIKGERGGLGSGRIRVTGRAGGTLGCRNGTADGGEERQPALSRSYRMAVPAGVEKGPGPDCSQPHKGPPPERSVVESELGASRFWGLIAASANGAGRAASVLQTPGKLQTRTNGDHWGIRGPCGGGEGEPTGFAKRPGDVLLFKQQPAQGVSRQV